MHSVCTPEEYYRLSLVNAGYDDPTDLAEKLAGIAERTSRPLPVVKLANQFYEAMQRDDIPYASNEARSEDAFAMAEGFLEHQAVQEKQAQTKVDRLLEKLASAAEDWAKDADLDDMDPLDLVRCAGLQAQSVQEMDAADAAVKGACGDMIAARMEEAKGKKDDEKDASGDYNEAVVKGEIPRPGEEEKEEEGKKAEGAAPAPPPQPPGQVSDYMVAPDLGMQPGNIHTDQYMATLGNLAGQGSKLPGMTPGDWGKWGFDFAGVSDPSRYPAAAHEMATHHQEQLGGQMTPDAAQGVLNWSRGRQTGLPGWLRQNKLPLAGGAAALGLGAAYLMKQRGKRKQQEDEVSNLERAVQQKQEGSTNDVPGT